jgi:hypothetical protein
VPSVRLHPLEVDIALPLLIEEESAEQPAGAAGRPAGPASPAIAPIVMGVNHRPGDALFFGRTATKTLANVKASVLLVSSWRRPR